MNSRTHFSIGASVSTSAADREDELDRVEQKVRAGAHFLLTDAIYDLGVTREVIAALRARGIETPVIAALAPFDDPITIARLTHEMPDESRPTAVTDRDPIEMVLDVADNLSDVVAGIFVHAPARPDPRLNGLLLKLLALRLTS